LKRNKVLCPINGAGGTGKDTFIYYCTEYAYKEYRIICKNFSTIDPVKQFARHFGYKDIKDEKERTFLVELKNAWKKFNNGPVRYIEGEVKYNNVICGKDKIIYFVHTREPKEIYEFSRYFIENNIVDYVIPILLKRKKVKTPECEKILKLEEFDYNYIYEMNDLSDSIYYSKMFIDLINKEYFLKGENKNV
jgi:hypothetical protein